jgi:ubiquinone/menaquinone biosynthesis C-methylase UbiE
MQNKANKAIALQAYDQIDKIFGDDDIVDFMNHGYHPPSKLLGDDIFMKNQASLYIHLLKHIETKGLKILDIGCGRGGGTNVLRRYFSFAEVHGCDLNSNNISTCKRKHKDVEFRVSDAEKLDYTGGYFDLVMNVESSHCYDDLKAFVSEANRVIKSGGKLLHTDIELVANPTITPFFRGDKTFSAVEEEDITRNVIDSCQHDLAAWENLPDSASKRFLLDLTRNKLNLYIQGIIRYKTFICTKGTGPALLKT